MMKGKVKFFNESKGFGFVVADDGNEYFVHISGFADSNLRLKENSSVKFDVEKGDRGMKAVNVSLDGSGKENHASSEDDN